MYSIDDNEKKCSFWPFFKLNYSKSNTMHVWKKRFHSLLLDNIAHKLLPNLTQDISKTIFPKVMRIFESCRKIYIKWFELWVKKFLLNWMFSGGTQQKRHFWTVKKLAPKNCIRHEFQSKKKQNLILFELLWQ